MAIPTWDQLIRPVLEFARDQGITRKSATEHVLSVVPLTDEERKERIKSGPTKIANRTGWAMSHLTKAGLIEKVAKATYRATEKGRDFLTQHNGKEITYHDLRAVEGFKEAWAEAKKRKAEAKASKSPEEDDRGSRVSDSTPEELIATATESLDGSLRDELLSQLADVDPYRFEQVVVDLLFAMGYGGSREEAAQVTKKSNDEGIDGIINEDRLGLDVIYVQAKRWKNTIGRKEIQSFVGALAGQQANKGVFITTSDFANTATEYADTVTQKVILIDGARLADLMIEHNIGVSTIRTIALKRIDSDYFEEG